jgi:putative hydrolase of the HAD superfamily
VLLASEIEAILFDLDDTLVMDMAAADAAFFETVQPVAERYGLDPLAMVRTIREQARPFWHASPAREYVVKVGPSSWEGLWARFEADDPNVKILHDWAPAYRLSAWSAALAKFGIHDSSLAATLAEEFQARRRQHHRLYPEAWSVLEALHGKFKLGLVTNGLSCLQREKLAGVGIAPFFGAIAISGDLGIGKPCPEIFHAVLDSLGVRPDQAIMVGNSVKGDIAGAQATGMKAILIDRGDPHGQDAAITPDAVIRDLTETLDYLGVGRLV